MGIPEHRIVELDWHQSAKVDELTLICMPARHFSGRLLDRNTTLWASWAFVGPNHRVYFGGDTGYTKSFAQIGADHGPFDLTLLPIGAYNTAWPDIHMNPEEAVRAHLDVTDPARGCWCRSTGARSGSPASVGRAGRAPARCCGARPRRGGGAHARAARRQRDARPIESVVAAVI